MSYKKWGLAASIVVLSVLIGLRIYAPTYIVNAVNTTLDNTDGISGSVEDIDLAIFRGAYQINGLKLYLQENYSEEPSISIDTVEISVLWSAIFRGELVTEVDIYSALFTFVDRETKDDAIKEAATQKETWLTLIDFASPISIDRINIHDSSLSLSTQVGNNEQVSFIDNIDAQVLNITNSYAFSGDKIARFSASGKFMSEANATLSGSINPDTKKPSFDVNFEMQKLNVEHLDELIQFYAPIDVEKGSVDAAMEIVANNGEVEGYIKAGIFDADVFTWKDDIEKDGNNILVGLFEGLIDGISSIFESGKNDLIAVEVPISGTLDNTEISTWEAFKSLLHNAFVNEYQIKVEDEFSADGESSLGSISQAKQFNNHFTQTGESNVSS